ncbi:MAG TPA: autotransporter domain-containing protein [Rhabdochlamydiaceae bacterium]|jgi:uncharacterized protein with beta-barrel porin domain|nr:autotransporter domain-containing protein [Rhabdochlamydiaceae bacterium]
MFKHCLFLFTSHSLLALTTLNVSVNTDNNPDGYGEIGDLRYALNTMNQGLNIGPEDYAIVFNMPMTVQLNGILPIINNSPNAVNITIGNSGSIPTVTIDGNMGAYSGFFIPTGNVTIQNMIFQNMTAKGGDGGDGISGGGGGMGAGGAIYAPQSFLNGSNPSITLMNVSINSCSAVGGNGGSYFSISSPTGNEGGGGGGGFSGNGGSITIDGSTGGGGGGGFGGDGGNITLSNIDPNGGGGGGGGGLGSRANMGTPMNLGNGGSDADVGLDGNGYGLSTSGGSGGGGYTGGNRAGGGGGGDITGGSTDAGGGGGGSSGSTSGTTPRGSIPPGGSAAASGGNGGDGGGGGGGGVVITDITNGVDGQAGTGGYGGGGGGGAGIGASDTAYTVQGGSGGVGGGGGGGGVNLSGSTPATGGDSLGGGGGGGGGPSNGLNALGGSDIGNLGGGSGGSGDSTIGSASGGGPGGGGSGLGGAIFVDSGLNLTIQAFTGIPTTFNTSNTTTQAGSQGAPGPGGTPGFDGSALGNSIFLRSGSSLTFMANDANDLLTLGDQVAFIDDTSFGVGGTSVFVRGNGTVIYNGTTDYQGSITINNANFKVNGLIDQASVAVCRNVSFSSQRGTLSGIGTLTGAVFVNSGTISPDTGGMLTLGSLSLNSADPINGTLGSLVHIEIDSNGTSLVSVNGPASLAGTLEIGLDLNAQPGQYTILTSSNVTGTFDSITFTGTTPNYSLSYLPIGAPTYVQFDFLGFSPSDLTLSTAGLGGNNLRVANYLNTLGLANQFTLLNSLSFSEYKKALESISPSRNSLPSFVAQNITFMFAESLYSQFTKRRLTRNQLTGQYANQTALVAENDISFARAPQSPRNTIYSLPKETSSKIWGMGFGQFSHQNSQNQTPAFDFNGGGFCVAYDYGNTDQGFIGTLAGYAYSSIDEHHSMGSSNINAGYLSIYGTRFFSDFFLEAAVWGDFMRVNQKRTISYSGFKKTAKSSYNAEQLDLHYGMGYDFNIDTVTIEPFALIDWIHEWDPSYKEKGAAPYKMKISSRTSWMLRLETGLNGYKTATYDWGVFIAQGKLSYVYKKPHHVGHLTAAIASAPGSFFVDAFTTSQNLVSPGIELFWQTNSNVFASMIYNGEFGSGYRSNQFYARVGYAF